MEHVTASYVLSFMFLSTLWRSGYYLFSRNRWRPRSAGLQSLGLPLCYAVAIGCSAAPCPLPSLC